MLKKELESIINKYSKFKPIKQYSSKQIYEFTKKFRVTIKEEDIIAIYDFSSLFKTNAIILCTDGLYITNDAPIIFKQLLKIELLNNHIYLETIKRSTQRVHVESKDAKMIYDLLTQILELMKKKDVKEKQVEKTTKKAINTKNKTKVEKVDHIAYAVQQFEKGEAFYNNKDYDNAFVCYSEAASNGHTLSKVYLGYAYEYGQGIEVDIKKAKQLYEEGIKEGEVLGYFRLGEYYYFKEKNYEQAAKCYKEAADRNHSKSAYYYAQALKKGEGVQQNLSEAAKYYKKAADLGHASAMVSYGVCLQKGDGVIKDEQEAIVYFEKAANEGYAYGYYNLGLIYYYGEVVKKDVNKAIEYFKLAANAGHKYSCHMLFDFYYEGKEVSRDDQQAIYWAQKGVDYQSDNSIVDLGLIYAYRNERTDYALELLLEGAKKDSRIAKIALVVYTACHHLKPDLETMKKIVEYGKETGRVVEEIRIIENYIKDMELPSQDVASKITELEYDLSDESLKKIFDLVIRHKYIPNIDFYERLCMYLVDFFDSDFTYACEVQSKIDEIYKESVKNKTEPMLAKVKTLQQNHQHHEAIKLLEEIYNLDRREVAYNLGDYYFEGKHIPQNYNIALEWYKKANSVDGSIKVAEIYMLLGNKVEGKKKLVELAKRSNKAKEKLIHYVLQGDIKDTDSVIPFIKEALKANDLTENNKKKLQKLIDEYERVHEEQLLLERGKSLWRAKKFEEAIECYSQASKKYKNTHAMSLAAYTYKNDLHNEDKFEYWLLMAAKANDENACYNLAHVYKDKNDTKKYNKWIKKAADLGHKKANKEYQNTPTFDSSCVMVARHTSKCRHCGVCVDVCLVSCIEEKGGRVYVNKDECIGCGICLDECPYHAIELVKA